MSTPPEGTSLSSRGFQQLAPIITSRNQTVRVYESSAASGPHVWINVDDNCAHLTLEQTAQLRDQLSWLIENHYQVGPS